jgi:tetratricopeptide (TPR) repeat protein
MAKPDSKRSQAWKTRQVARQKTPGGVAELSAPNRPARSVLRSTEFWVAGFLFLLVMVVFYPSTHNGFVDLDDLGYLCTNVQVQKGLTWNGVLWAFRTGCANNWHPLTWLSLMLDVQLCGTGPAGPHLTNVILHAVNTVLLFLLLRRLTGRSPGENAGAPSPPASTLWPSAFVAAVFAVHPLHVESVAWVSERKDVLSGLFFLLTLWAYLCYTRKKAASGSRRWPSDYSLALFFFALGLMSKPMLVTVPFVLLLLDYWPLRRFEVSTFRRLALEKAPFLVLSAASCVATVLAQREAIKSMIALPLNLRFGNALISFVTYLVQMVWPANLAVFYPYRQNTPVWQFVGAGVLLLSITVLAVLAMRRFPCFPVGWLWYLGMLVPVIGLVQVGGQSHADRYTYLPQIGLYLAIVWAIRDLTRSWRWRRPVLGVAAFSVTAALAVCARNQIACWRNDDSLWGHTLACTTGNYFAHYNLGYALAAQGRAAEAIEHYKQAVLINPNFVWPYNNLGILLGQQGRAAEAIEYYQKAIKLNPNLAELHSNLGILLAQQGRMAEAIGNLQVALKLDPTLAKVHFNLGMAFAEIGRLDDAVAELKTGLTLTPNEIQALCSLGTLLNKQGRFTEAAQPFQAALRVDPNNAVAHCGLGIALLQNGQLEEAINQLREALRLKPDYAEAHTCLDTALSLKKTKGPLIPTNAGPSQ